MSKHSCAGCLADALNQRKSNAESDLRKSWDEHGCDCSFEKAFDDLNNIPIGQTGQNWGFRFHAIGGVLTVRKDTND